MTNPDDDMKLYNRLITDEMVEKAMDAANSSPHGREDYCTLSMMTRALEAVAPMLIAQGRAAGLLEACQSRFTCNTDNHVDMTYEGIRRANLEKRAAEVLAALDPPPQQEEKS
jgi:hypothetical protein